MELQNTYALLKCPPDEAQLLRLMEALREQVARVDHDLQAHRSKPASKNIKMSEKALALFSK